MLEQYVDPRIDKPTQVFILLMVILSYYPLAPEINLTVFGVGIIYIGTIQSLDNYEL